MRIVLLWLSLLWLGPAYAYGTITGTSTPTTHYGVCKSGGSTDAYAPMCATAGASTANWLSAADACAAAVSAYNAGEAIASWTTTSVCSGPITNKTNGSSLGTRTLTVYTATKPVTSCPSGSTASGSTCVCAAGTKPGSATTCVPYTCAPGPDQMSIQPSDLYVGTSTAAVSVCGSNPSGDQCLWNSSVSYCKGSSCYAGGWTASSKPCNAGPADATVLQTLQQPKTCPAGQVVIGQVNGVDTCGKPSSTVEQGKSTTTNPDGSKSTTSTETRCDGVQCTTTETTVTTPAGGGATSTTTKETTKPDPDAAVTPADPASSPGLCDDPANCTATAPPTSADLRTAGTRTVGDALQGIQSTLLATPVGGVVGSFFALSLGGQTCPVFTSQALPIIGTLTFDLHCAPFVSAALAMLGYCMVAIAAFRGFRIAFE